VQKGYPISKEERELLRKKNLIEGPASRTCMFLRAWQPRLDTQADYIRNRPFDRAYFKDMVVAYLRTYHEAKESGD